MGPNVKEELLELEDGEIELEFEKAGADEDTDESMQDEMISFAKSVIGDAEVDEMLDNAREDYEEFMKAGKGPGSRGGKIVGYTRGGKPIYGSKKKATEKRSDSRKAVRSAKGGAKQASSQAEMDRQIIAHLEAKGSKKKSKSKMTRGYKEGRKMPSKKKAGRGK